MYLPFNFSNNQHYELLLKKEENTGEFLLCEEKCQSLISNGEKPKVAKIQWATTKKSKINIFAIIVITNLYTSKKILSDLKNIHNRGNIFE